MRRSKSFLSFLEGIALLEYQASALCQGGTTRAVVPRPGPWARYSLPLAWYYLRVAWYYHFPLGVCAAT